MSITRPSRFESAVDPGRYINYVFMPSTGTYAHAQTLQYCYGAGGSCLTVNRYQDFLLSHPGLNLLCVERWCQGMGSSEDNMLGALSDITAELLHHLKISSVSLAAHSAGIYQALDLATRYSTLVDKVFPMCSHVPAQLTASKAMTFMTRAPMGVVQMIGRIDTMNPPDYLRPLLGLPLEVDDTLVVSRAKLQQIRAHRLSAEEELMTKRRRELDYALCYEHLGAYSGNDLITLYSNCPRPLVWLTTIQDKFFGPATAQRVLDLQDTKDSRVVRFDGAHHANIYMKTEVWELLYKTTCQERGVQ